MQSGPEDIVLKIIGDLAIGSDGIDSQVLADQCGLDHQILVDTVLKSLIAREVLTASPKAHQSVQLTSEGEKYCTDGSPEVIVFQKIAASPDQALKMEELEELVGKDLTKLGMQNALKNKWIGLEKSTKMLTCKVESVQDHVQEMLKNVQHLNDADMKVLKQRKLIVIKTFKTFEVTRGEHFSTTLKETAAELTAEMLNTGSWSSVHFKSYNFEADGKNTESGCLHPLLKVREQFRLLFVQLGFEEMPTDNYVESSFWNFDALFQPQQHPARDAHDTFFLSDPICAQINDRDYFERVKTVHEKGGYGSLGYQYQWEESEAKTTILRTHTTAVSSRVLHKLASDYLNECKSGTNVEFKPRKYFSIDRVFRNETLDATHLAEFHQIEGLVAGRGLSLADLKGVIGEFFRKLGMKKLRFKPAHNPYTEPSMEIFSYHDGLQKWVEVGNSGIFRPEMLRPMGLPADVRVIAWGLSLERPTMIMYGIKNIRDLFGHKVDISTIKSNPMCRLGLSES